MTQAQFQEPTTDKNATNADTPEAEATGTDEANDANAEGDRDDD